MKWNEKELNEIVNLVKLGKRYDEISKITGRDENSIRVKLGKLGKTFTKYNPPIKNNCLQCDLKIEHNGKKFCSSSCSAKYNNTLRDSKITIGCLNCKTEFKTNKQNSKYCSRICFNLQRKKIKYAEIEKGECKAVDTGTHKKYLCEKHGEKCMECGWKTINKHTGKIPLELHHVDGDPDNNKLNNLQVLCPNCHSLTKTWKGAKRDNGRYSKRRLKRRQDYKDGKSC